MPTALILDTDVLIDYLRGQPQALGYIDGLTKPLAVCAMTVAELYAGVRKGREQTELDQFLRAFAILPIDDAIASMAGLLRRDYGKSHNVSLADAFIAATTITRGSKLVTLNKKHFPMLKDVEVPYRKP